MNFEETDPKERLVDMLLCELVANETPPDLLDRVLAATKKPSRPAPVRKKVTRRPKPSRPVRPSVFPAFLSAAATVALLVGAGAFFYANFAASARTPAVTLIEGTANCAKGPVESGDMLETGPESKIELTYEDGTVVELDSETSVVVMKQSYWARSKKIRLVSGKVTARVTPQPPGNPMTLESNDATAEVIGTTLSFQHRDGASRLEVSEGTVRFVSHSGDNAVLVESGNFAESGKPGFRVGKIVTPPEPGITRFTLMNATTDAPIRAEGLRDGETISLASLPTREINIRTDFEGGPPVSVKLIVTREDGAETGLPPSVNHPQKYPPFFVAGDFWAEGRPDDCRAWTPKPGLYFISATAVYSDEGRNERRDRKIEIRFAD